MSVVTSEIMYGIDYVSNIHLFDFKKEKEYFYSFMCSNLRISKEKLSNIVNVICKKYDINTNDIYRLDHYFKSLFYICSELGEKYESYEDSVYGLYLTPLDSLIYCKDVKTENSSITNMVAGSTLYTILRKNKSEYKCLFESIYNHFSYILRDDVNVLDIINNSKYHTIIQDADIGYDIHIISDELN